MAPCKELIKSLKLVSARKVFIWPDCNDDAEIGIADDNDDGLNHDFYDDSDKLFEDFDDDDDDCDDFDDERKVSILPKSTIVFINST